MSAQLNHTIVHCRSKETSAAFLADILGLPKPKPFGPFLVVELANGVSLDFDTTEGKITTEHYAFLVSDAEFDGAFGRIQERGLTYWADPGRTRTNALNHHNGGRGCYFKDPDGHLLELLTRP
ncbi:MAG TPA: VOC family protein [Alphaproteobacteria bacterium]|jgi:catechol 2,3-dioxygenase-like lactoylglutathione lyase family enzyme|nr:VOC family protein [Alphaproteobacteria bacterium]